MKCEKCGKEKIDHYQIPTPAQAMQCCRCEFEEKSDMDLIKGVMEKTDGKNIRKNFNDLGTGWFLPKMESSPKFRKDFQKWAKKMKKQMKKEELICKKCGEKYDIPTYKYYIGFKLPLIHLKNRHFGQVKLCITCQLLKLRKKHPPIIVERNSGSHMADAMVHILNLKKEEKKNG